MFNARPVLTSNISHPIEQKSGSHITRLSITNNSSDHSIDMSDDDDVVLPKPPTSNLMINRLTSIIDESLTNIQYLVHDIELKRRDSQKQLDNVHKTLRNLIDKKQKQYESDINEYFKKHNENILKSETYLKQLKFQLLDLCCDFNINNYKYIEQLTKTTIEKVFIEPNICNKLTDADKFLDLTWQCYIAKNDGQQEQEQEQTNCKEENLISNNRTNNHHYVLSGVKEEDESKSQSFSPVKTTSSIGKATVSLVKFLVTKSLTS
ncbi:unnamed protein product [Didymodactylos carnosus]|uniref:Uncharacterized protein n=1 Tax=Didymodactylos carnosus TaxID=1234261 RepID=A0A8S2F5P4_9BILA|nr:unnamed protein product [Didymodactylos carnosus]CAF4145871.1 unnamed protein product [Didymodactylos carnosus]